MMKASNHSCRSMIENSTNNQSHGQVSTKSSTGGPITNQDMCGLPANLVCKSCGSSERKRLSSREEAISRISGLIDEYIDVLLSPSKHDSWRDASSHTTTVASDDDSCQHPGENKQQQSSDESPLKYSSPAKTSLKMSLQSLIAESSQMIPLSLSPVKGISLRNVRSSTKIETPTQLPQRNLPSNTFSAGESPPELLGKISQMHHTRSSQRSKLTCRTDRDVDSTHSDEPKPSPRRCPPARSFSRGTSLRDLKVDWPHLEPPTSTPKKSATRISVHGAYQSLDIESSHSKDSKRSPRRGPPARSFSRGTSLRDLHVDSCYLETPTCSGKGPSTPSTCQANLNLDCHSIHSVDQKQNLRRGPPARSFSRGASLRDLHVDQCKLKAPVCSEESASTLSASISHQHIDVHSSHSEKEKHSPRRAPPARSFSRGTSLRDLHVDSCQMELTEQLAKTPPKFSRQSPHHESLDSHSSHSEGHKFNRRRDLAAGSFARGTSLRDLIVHSCHMEPHSCPSNFSSCGTRQGVGEVQSTSNEQPKLSPIDRVVALSTIEQPVTTSNRPLNSSKQSRVDSTLSCSQPSPTAVPFGKFMRGTFLRDMKAMQSLSPVLDIDETQSPAYRKKSPLQLPKQLSIRNLDTEEIPKGPIRPEGTMKRGVSSRSIKVSKSPSLSQYFEEQQRVNLRKNSPKFSKHLSLRNLEVDLSPIDVPPKTPLRGHNVENRPNVNGTKSGSPSEEIEATKTPNARSYSLKSSKNLSLRNLQVDSSPIDMPPRTPRRVESVEIHPDIMAMRSLTLVQDSNAVNSRNPRKSPTIFSKHMSLRNLNVGSSSIEVLPRSIRSPLQDANSPKTFCRHMSLRNLNADSSSIDAPPRTPRRDLEIEVVTGVRNTTVPQAQSPMPLVDESQSRSCIKSQSTFLMSVRPLSLMDTSSNHSDGPPRTPIRGLPIGTFPKSMSLRDINSKNGLSPVLETKYTNPKSPRKRSPTSPFEDKTWEFSQKEKTFTIGSMSIGRIQAVHDDNVSKSKFRMETPNQGFAQSNNEKEYIIDNERTWNPDNSFRNKVELEFERYDQDSPNCQLVTMGPSVKSQPSLFGNLSNAEVTQFSCRIGVSEENVVGPVKGPDDDDDDDDEYGSSLFQKRLKKYLDQGVPQCHSLFITSEPSRPVIKNNREMDPLTETFHASNTRHQKSIQRNQSFVKTLTVQLNRSTGDLLNTNTLETQFHFTRSKSEQFLTDVPVINFKDEFPRLPRRESVNHIPVFVDGSDDESSTMSSITDVNRRNSDVLEKSIVLTNFDRWSESSSLLRVAASKEDEQSIAANDTPVTEDRNGSRTCCVTPAESSKAKFEKIEELIEKCILKEETSETELGSDESDATCKETKYLDKSKEKKQFRNSISQALSHVSPRKAALKLKVIASKFMAKRKQSVLN